MFVDEEAAIGIAVEDESEIRPGLDDGVGGVDEVLGLERIRFVVGEGAVEFRVQPDHLEGHRGGSRVGAEDLPEEPAGHAVAGVEDDLQSCTSSIAGQCPHPRDVLFAHGLRCPFVDGDGTAIVERCRGGELPDSGQTGGEADPGGAAAES